MNGQGNGEMKSTWPVDPRFRKARLTEAHRRLDVWRVVKGARPFLRPIALDLRDLERDAEAVLSGWRKPE